MEPTPHKHNIFTYMCTKMLYKNCIKRCFFPISILIVSLRRCEMKLIVEAKQDHKFSYVFLVCYTL